MGILGSVVGYRVKPKISFLTKIAIIHGGSDSFPGLFAIICPASREIETDFDGDLTLALQEEVNVLLSLVRPDHPPQNYCEGIRVIPESECS